MLLKDTQSSEEGLADIIQANLNFTGGMDQHTKLVLGVQYTEDPRMWSLIQQAIPTREAPPHNASVKESQ